MPILHLVRHGQASFGAANYDCLSDLGRQQARWLGEHFAQSGQTFARTVCGELIRQKDTAALILEALPDSPRCSCDISLNEYRAGEVLRAHGNALGSTEDAVRKDDVRAYFQRLRAALIAWSGDAGLAGVTESWPQFGARIDRSLRACIADLPRDAHVLVVTSGGVIARAVADALGVTPQVAVELHLQARNTGVTQLLITQRGVRLVSFNAVPHLERADRRQAVTYT